jgi:glycosyltransferase involved in cell wall biosynthesis
MILRFIMAPHVSIVIPAYNEARRLPGTLAGWHSFFQTQPYAWEFLVVDDGSRDATAAVAEAAGARALRLDRNQGKGGAVKAGVLAADGQIIAYADADMNVAPTHLAAALSLLDAGADLVVGRRDLSEYALAEGVVRLLAKRDVTTTYRAESTFNVRQHLPVFLHDILQIRLNDLHGRYTANRG